MTSNINTRYCKQDIVRDKLIQWLQGVVVGTRLQSERELAAGLDVSRCTIRLAVDELVESGLLTRVHGSGVYVTRSLSGPKRKICVAYHNEKDPMRYPFLVSLLHQLELEIIGSGATVLIAHMEEGTLSDTALNEADGIVALSPLDPSLIPEGKPVVVLFDPNYSLPDASYVLSDDHMNGIIAAKYLITLGHKNIAFVADIEHYSWAQDRYKGICDIAAKSSLSRPVLETISFDQPISTELAERLKSDNVSAVICANDYVAIGLISALHKIGLEVPENISVVGFDDVPNAAFFHPPLTTVKQPVKEAVATAVAELEQRMTVMDNDASKKITLPAKMIIRQSCMPYSV